MEAPFITQGREGRIFESVLPSCRSYEIKIRERLTCRTWSCSRRPAGSPVHVEAGDTGRGHTIGIGVVQRNGGQVVEQHFPVPAGTACWRLRRTWRQRPCRTAHRTPGSCSRHRWSRCHRQRRRRSSAPGSFRRTGNPAAQPLRNAPFTLRSDTAVRKSLKVGYGLVAATPAPSTLLMELTTAV